MRAVPRHRFLPAEFAEHAYDDGPLANRLGTDDFAALHGRADERGRELRRTRALLEVGTGSGYQTAILARLAAEVYSVEFIDALHDRARAILNAMGIDQRASALRRRIRGMARGRALRRRSS